MISPHTCNHPRRKQNQTLAIIPARKSTQTHTHNTSPRAIALTSLSPPHTIMSSPVNTPRAQFDAGPAKRAVRGYRAANNPHPPAKSRKIDFIESQSSRVQLITRGTIMGPGTERESIENLPSLCDTIYPRARRRTRSIRRTSGRGKIFSPGTKGST